MSAPGRQGDVYRARAMRVVDRCEGGPEREAAPPVPVPPGRCPRCGEEKAWLRPGETCAPCLVPKGRPARLVIEDEEDDMAKKKPARRTATCEECDQEFDASPFGRLPKRCEDCKGRPVASTKAEAEEPEDEDEAQEEEAEEAGAGAEDGEESAPGLPFNDTHVMVLAELAAARGVDPVDALLTAIAAAVGR